MTDVGRIIFNGDISSCQIGMKIQGFATLQPQFNKP